MSVKEALIAAKAMIETPETWIKNEFEAEGCYCALGAVSMVLTGDADYDKNWYIGSTDKVALALAAQLPDRFAYVSDFNDDPATTHNDVLQLFDRAIEAAS
jgi:hypothetical protein